MNDCCKQAIADFVAKINDKFGPMMDTKDPNTPMTEEQFGMVKVVVFMSGLLEDISPQGD
jgi:hypothetical protein